MYGLYICNSKDYGIVSLTSISMPHNMDFVAHHVGHCGIALQSKSKKPKVHVSVDTPGEGGVND